MNKYYTESLNEKTILNNRVGKKLLEYVTPYEAIQTLRRYNIGTAKDNEPAFWYTNENGEPYALQVKKEYYFGEPDVWNIQALQNKKCFAIVTNTNSQSSGKLKTKLNARLYQYDDFKEELFKTGAPVRAILPYGNKYPGSWYSRLEKFLSDEGLQKLTNSLGLELV